MLAIEFATRRRLPNQRDNRGRPERTGDARPRKCSQLPERHSQRRQPYDISSSASAVGPARRGHALDDDTRVSFWSARTRPSSGACIRAERGVDTARPRRRRQGSSRLSTRRPCACPTTRGNSMFMTLGNFAIDSPSEPGRRRFRAAGSRPLSFGIQAGSSSTPTTPIHLTGGTRRFWDFAVREWVAVRSASPLCAGSCSMPPRSIRRQPPK